MLKLNATRKIALAKIAGRHRLRLILAFGSIINNQTRPDSDLDLAVWGKTAVNPYDSTLLADLQKIFPGREVDLVALNHADPLLLKQVAGAFQTLFGPREEAEAFRLYALSRYQDFAPQLKKEAAFVTAALKP